MTTTAATAAAAAKPSVPLVLLIILLQVLVRGTESFSSRPSFSSRSSSSSSSIPMAVSSSSSSPPPPSGKEESPSSPEPLLVSLRDLLGIASDDDDDDDDGKVELVLASASPRRREILGMMGLAEGVHFSVEPSPLDESKLQAELRGSVSPVEYTLRLAEAKASALADARCRTTSGDDGGDGGGSVVVVRRRFVLGSDTIVELDGAILEKPKDEADAGRMIRAMRGKRHRVHTGVALYRLDERREGGDATVTATTLVGSFVDTASVAFADLTDEDVDAYVRSGEPMDKAGSYGIQGIGGQLVTEIRGDFFTVMGLPMHRTSKLIAEALLVLLRSE
eukprot:CAMPEP_0197179050 /NCGR_PEP_ID=MMETSP1423-20130617/4125_1 /TAXON_ID=476441 /ORGANISM="Pseudo-nitzschia heimii, Strain UNC1101" /LENGTH=334 /DNA_ID=CAMNT_0042628899 /DNA_START=151 /DNA_END=1155 /DNA_ORIENTATION=-